MVGPRPGMCSAARRMPSPRSIIWIMGHLLPLPTHAKPAISCLMIRDPAEVLSSVFGFAGFRGVQEQVIADVVAGRDVALVMPTGAGKSLCYQIPALCRPGCGIV